MIIEYCHRRFRSCALLFVTLVLVVTVAQAQDTMVSPKEWKLSTAVGSAFAVGKAGERWAKLIAEKSDGKFTVQMFPGATLARRDPAREFLALRDGAADLAVGSTLFWSIQVSELALIGLPWLAPDDKDLGALLMNEVIASQLFAAVERAGAVPLALAALGHREIATTGRVLRSPADLNAMKVRATSLSLVRDMFVALGAEPWAMAFADAQVALRAGILDAQEGQPATFAAARLDALGFKQVLLWGAVAEVAIFAANQTVWKSWSDEERAIVKSAAQQAARELPALARAENDAALAELRQRGITVTRLTATGRAAFAAAARGVYDKWASVAGPELVRVAEAAIKGTTP